MYLRSDESLFGQLLCLTILLIPSKPVFTAACRDSSNRKEGLVNKIYSGSQVHVKRV